MTGLPIHAVLPELRTALRERGSRASNHHSPFDTLCTKLTVVRPGTGRKQRPTSLATTSAFPVRRSATCRVDGSPSTKRTSVSGSAQA